MSFKGFEVEILTRPVENLTVSLTYGYVDSEIEEYIANAAEDLIGNKLLNSNDMDLNGSIRYDLRIGKLGVLSPRFEWVYVGAAQNSLENNTGESGDFWTSNARLNCRDNDSELGVSLFVENISDDINVTRLVYNDIAIVGADGAYVTRPLVYGVTISYQF